MALATSLIGMTRRCNLAASGCRRGKRVLDNGGSQFGFLAMAAGIVGCSAFKKLKQDR